LIGQSLIVYDLRISVDQCVVEQLGHLGVHSTAGHVAVLTHRHLRVAEVVGTDAGRQSGVVDERCQRLAEAVRADVWHAQWPACAQARTASMTSTWTAVAE